MADLQQEFDTELAQLFDVHKRVREERNRLREQNGQLVRRVEELEAHTHKLEALLKAAADDKAETVGWFRRCTAAVRGLLSMD